MNTLDLALRNLLRNRRRSLATLLAMVIEHATPPERIWLSMSVSEPSWLDGKIWMSTRPLVSCLMAADISRERTLIGCVSGRLLANL